MIVVTGSARTGTSMMMQTLVHLGYPTVAPPFIKEHKNIREANPKGFYELNMADLMNVSSVDVGKAIKVFGNAIPFFDKSLIHKLIVMKRNRERAIVSSVPVFNGLSESHVDPALVYDSSYKIIDCITSDVSTIFINFEDVIANPEKEINRLVEFLERDFDNSKIRKAINNINT